MEIRKVGVVGLGTMGAGIAQVAAQSGFETVGREVSEELCERARGTIEHYLGRAFEKGRLTSEERDAAIGRLTFTTELADLAKCDLVIEAIVEELEPKQETFAELRMGEEVEVRTRCSRIGTKSFDLDHEIATSSGRIVAEAKSVLVSYDYERGESIAVPETLRALLQP